MPSLHVADAATHAPLWMMVLLVLAGAGLGVVLTSGGGMLRRLHREGDGPAMHLLRWGRRDDTWWGEVEVGAGSLLVDGWHVRTRSGRVLAPAVEVVREAPPRTLGLVVVLEGDDAVTEIRCEPRGAPPWRQVVQGEVS
ncbi:MAG: hypothetical protein M0R74_14850 [Dehalococcoidia bacterium]|nr:hypothetical protein [Dehalococcoidia bacterium]